jgi:antitoxin component of MazEF toxin-antitoxin module
MKLEIQKIGDDLVLILPDGLIRQLGWAQGNAVSASVE